jgi:transposase-like protein
MIWRPEADLVGLEAGEADRITRMDCVGYGSASVTERREVTGQGYRRFRCRNCGRQFNERSGEVLN